jgi:hypothetical protein
MLDCKTDTGGRKGFSLIPGLASPFNADFTTLLGSQRHIISVFIAIDLNQQ